MTSLVMPSYSAAFGTVTRTVAEAVKSQAFSGNGAFSIEKSPTDSIGTFALTLTNLVIGSVVRIEIAGSGAEIEARTADTTTEVFAVPVYSTGSASNDLRIKVRKGSAAPKYLPFSTLATAVVGAGSVYVAQVPDPIA